MNQEQRYPGVLTSVFGGDPGSVAETILHPDAKNVLAKTADILKTSPTGAHLLGVIYEKGVGVRVIKNRNAHGYSPTMDMIYLGAPPETTEPDPYVVLEFGAAMREIEQEMLGFTMPREDEDPLTAASIRHTKYLDIIVHMCRIAIELGEELKSTEYVDAIEDLGHGDVLKSLTAQSSDEAVVDAYSKARDEV